MEKSSGTEEAEARGLQFRGQSGKFRKIFSSKQNKTKKKGLFRSRMRMFS